MITAAPQDGSSNELCDWLELAAFATSDGRALLSQVNLGLEMEEDFEPEDLATEDDEREGRIQRVVAAVSERSRAMTTAYPFAIDDTGTFLVLNDTRSAGGDAYLFCLVVSNAAKNGLLYGDGPWKPDLPKARDLFQVCATVCCAGWIQGPAFSFGWPRIDDSSFLQKLHQIYPLYADGMPHASMPVWGPARVKDDDVDVLAFKREPDGRHGTGYLVAQAASGSNWKEKSIKNAVAAFHKTWFVRAPSSPVTEALAFPFVMDSASDADGADHESQAAIAGRFWHTTTIMGVLLYRHRVAHWIDVAVGMTSVVPIERMDELAQVTTFVDAYREQLKAAVEELS